MSVKNFISIVAIFALSLTLTACGGSKEENVKLQGAGASFPAPLYLKWFKSYSSAHPNVQVDYQSVGSGSGVKSFMDRTVDFGASDAAMKPEDMTKVDGGVQLLPMTAGSIVLAHSLKDVPNLKLSREAYVGIFSGKITKWNDPAIAKTNPDAKLPDAPINVIVRADSSGTTFVFTKHLSAVSQEFGKDTGVNNMPNWPVGTKSKGNEGITAALLTTPGSIGYIEYGYAHSQKLPSLCSKTRPATLWNRQLLRQWRLWPRRKCRRILLPGYPIPKRRTRIRSLPTLGCSSIRSTITKPKSKRFVRWLTTA